jgi:hypothetical protein
VQLRSRDVAGQAAPPETSGDGGVSPVEQAINHASEVYRERAALIIQRWGPEALALQQMWERECRRIREEG